MVTYDEILDRMIREYTKITGIVPSPVSDIYVRFSVLAGELYNTEVNMQWLRNQLLADTATGEFLDNHALERGLVRREASYAVGSVIFSLDSAAVSDIVIPKGTVVATSGDEPLCFETMEQVKIFAGTFAQHADVMAVEQGRKYNVLPYKISVIVTPVTGNMTVENPDPCEAGTDTESDESLRARVIASYKNPSNGTNCAYYEKVATEIPSVSSAAVVPMGRGAGTVDVYVASYGSDVGDETVKQVQSLLSEMREVNVDVLVKKATPAVINLNLNLDVADGYEFEDVKEACIQALGEYIDSRGVGGSVLLTEAGECVHHIDGVKEYSFMSYANSDTRCPNTHYPMTGVISVTQGVLV